MSFGILNLLMLAGLATVALPVVVHLISKRKFDIVSWGAMRFLELGRRTRRRIRLEELLLMLMRMAMLALLVFALARPWAQGGWLTQFADGGHRDIALVIDGSYSMGWEGKAITPHAAARQWALDLVDQLGPGDTITLLDARDQVANVFGTSTSDHNAVRKAIDELAEPVGSSNLATAAADALQTLSQTENVSRQVVVLTDRQAWPWNVDDQAAWLRFDELHGQPAVKPQVFVVDVTAGEEQDHTNFAVGRLELSRELTVPGFPIRVRTTVQQFGGVTTRRKVYFEVNGQRLDEKTLGVNVPPNSSVPVQFEHRFAAEGSYVVSVVLDADNLPGDNRSDAAIVVTDGVPALLIDGAPSRDPVRSETFFVDAALSASGNRSPWVRATTVDWQEFSPANLEGQDVVVLCNVPRLDEAQLAAVRAFVAAGGGLIIAPGDQIDVAFYNTQLANPEAPLLPATFGDVGREEESALLPINVADDSLTAAWLGRFRPGAGIDFLQARFARWWKLELAPFDQAAAGSTGDDVPAASAPSAVARLDTRDLFLASRDYGEGTVVQLAVPLDAGWSTFPARNDFVPFLHEMVFLVGGRGEARNVDVGMALEMPPPPGTADDDWSFVAPDGTALPAVRLQTEDSAAIRLPHTELAGVYRAVAKSDPDHGYFFVANADRAESNLTPLSQLEADQFKKDERLTFLNTVDDFREATLAEASRTEMWRWLMFAVLALLAFEVVMTRRLVQGGHESIDFEDKPGERSRAGAVQRG
jgi:Aerotolerance regulator N-terminal/von Willebrand factor type A domain